MEQDDDISVVPVRMTVERRWHAARRLAAGEDVHLAAARAGLHEAQVVRMLAEDAGFGRLIEAVRSMLALPAEARREAVEGLVRECVEDGLGARHATVRNSALRLVGSPLFGTAGEAGGSAVAPADYSHGLVMAALDYEELVEYLWIGVRDRVPFEERADLPFAVPEDFAERVQLLNERVRAVAAERRRGDEGGPEGGAPG